MHPVSAIQAYSQMNGIQGTSPAGASGAIGKSVPTGYGDLFQQFLQQTNTGQKMSDTAIENFVTGKSDNIQQVVLAVAEAEMSFRFFLEVRNKVIESYNELMRLQF